MRWTDTYPALAELPLPPDVALGPLARREVTGLVAVLADWHPELASGEAPPLLRPALYEEESALAGEEDRVAERPLCALLLRVSGVPAGALLLEYQQDEGALVVRLCAVSPICRGSGLGRSLLRAAERSARALGARVVYGLSPLDNLAQCALLETEGFSLMGVVPDSDRRQLAPGVTRYLPEGLYAKALVDAEALRWPEPARLTAATTRLFRLLDLPGAPPHLRASGGPEGADGAMEAVGAATAPEPPELLPPPEAGRWPEVTALAAGGAPPGYRLRALRREDLPALRSALPSWLPPSGAGAAQLLGGALEEEQVALAGEEQGLAARPAFALLLVATDEGADEGAAAVALCSYDGEGRTLFADCVAVAPRHRRRGLGAQLLRLVTLLGRAVGAETVLGWCPLRHVAPQRSGERAGWRLFALLPAARREGAEDPPRYGFEALYGVTLVPPELSRRPDSPPLPPRRAALLRALS